MTEPTDLYEEDQDPGLIRAIYAQGEKHSTQRPQTNRNAGRNAPRAKKDGPNTVFGGFSVFLGVRRTILRLRRRTNAPNQPTTAQQPASNRPASPTSSSTSNDQPNTDQTPAKNDQKPT